mmetsp:Transcript_15959/g.21100  ORF Transcript_15959/g.21100 Transcript_15959/m.21100 type:complete len:243 (-) Transcript_15959:423-1151(-)|eukprot:CAMPEP_0117751182 /NCGR_PEP_ID=MMETSP0947-20121206/10819_1 /TAXON_ID=44440 /ORGANISM="Chattonella subsalsa, Strain CCMP2191" /LENGTH=242 /DNA_ID=CAMNT_0005569507 /DNA_START=116 /DNA_END=844 /DNA_ORIENTATION=-
MPPRKARRKRAAALAESALNGPTDETMPNILTTNIDREQHAKNILQDIENEVEIRCQKIQKEADVLALQLKHSFSVELVRIPKGVRSMPLKKFCEEYGEDISTYLKVLMDNSIQQHANKSTGKRVHAPITSLQESNVPQTPYGYQETPACPPTKLRAPRPGELMLSAKGSPLGIAGATNVELKDEGKVRIALELQDGQKLDLDPNDSRMVHLPDEMKITARSKLKNLQNEIHDLLSKLDTTN